MSFYNNEEMESTVLPDDESNSESEDIPLSMCKIIFNEEPEAEPSGHEINDESEVDYNFSDTSDKDQIADDSTDTVAEVAENTDSKKGRKRKCNPENWKKNIFKQSRLSGKSYTTRKGVLVPEKCPKVIDCSKCKFKCQENISEVQRTEICKEYYLLSDSGLQKEFISNYVNKRNVARNRCKLNDPMKKKSVSYVFCLPGLSDNEHSKIRVCQKFFCHTLSISKKTVYLALVYTGIDGRKNRQPANKIAENRLQHVRDHINLFPRIEPHYCCAETTFQYLSPELNIKKMYDLYLSYCNENAIIDPVKEHKYREVFTTEFRLKCFVPKKDQCLVCNRFYAASQEEKKELEIHWKAHKQREKETIHLEGNHDTDNKWKTLMNPNSFVV